MSTEISIVKRFGAEVGEEGSVAVPAKILADIVPFCREE
jgi:DNA polymerase III sliding clamp (beta) subunit (PCNA family)